MSPNRSPGLKARLRACCTVCSPVGLEVTPPRCIRRLPCPVNTRTCSRLRNTVSACRKSTARIPAACASRNCRQVGPDPRGAGSMPAARKISHTVDGATVTPSFVSSPSIRRYPHSGFSLRQPDNEASTAPDYRRTARLASAAGVVLPRGQLAVPGQERCWRHGEDIGPAPAGEKPGQRGEPHPVSRLVPHAPGAAAQQRVLVPEH